MVTEVVDTGADGTIPGTGFTKAHQLFRETVRRFVDTEINPFIDAWEEAEIFPAHDLFKKAGDLGLLGLSYWLARRTKTASQLDESESCRRTNRSS